MTPHAPPPAPRLIDGPGSDGASTSATATVLLAHGAGAPMDSPFMAAMAVGLGRRGWRVVRFEFPFMARRRATGRRQGPDRLPGLEEAFREQVRLERTAAPHRPLIVGGKSLGGRVASLLVDALAASEGVRGCLCFGYPFHPPGRPLQLRTGHLADLQTPTLILQGERDPFGRLDEVSTYPLSSRLELEWMPSGDHSFKPTRASGLVEEDNWARAVEAADRFLRRLLAA